MTGEKLKVVLTGGGTGGHVYPSLAISNILEQKKMVQDILYLGARGKAEEKIVPRHNINISYVRTAPVAGLSPINKLRSLAIIAIGVIQAIKKLIAFKPQLIIGTGGYASAPIIFAAFILKPFLKLKIILEEQNLMPGLLNKAASLLADVVLLNYRESNYFVWSSRCIQVGYPVRKAYGQSSESKNQLKVKLGIPEHKKLVLVQGGSLGSRSINRALAGIIKHLSANDNIYIVHSIGLAENDSYHALQDTRNKMTGSLGNSFNPEKFEAYNQQGEIFYRGFQYIHNIFQWQKAADLIISRAGAGSLAEINALGKAALVVPKKGLPGDHQELNAISIAEKNACQVIFEKTDPDTKIDILDKKEFFSSITDLISNPQRLNELAKNSADNFHHSYVDDIFNAVQKTIKGEEHDYLLQIDPPQFVKLQFQFDNLIAYLDNLYNRNSPAEVEQNLYYRFYNHKIPEYLESTKYLIQNKGIKLVGTLKRYDYYPYLLENFCDYQGYLRRNILIGFKKADKFYPLFKEAVIKGLSDPYYETRREAISLFIRFHTHLKNEDQINNSILQMLPKKLESFEVISQAIKAAVLILPEIEFVKIASPFCQDRNLKLRQALLDAVKLGINHNRFSNSHNIFILLNRMLISTSEFLPKFKIKENFNQVINSLNQTGETNQVSGSALRK